MPTSLRASAARTLGVLSCVVGVALTSTPAASAASKTVRDTTDDVYSLTAETPTKVAGPNGDIVSVTTSHGAKNVRIRIQARHLSLEQAVMIAKVRTGPTGPTYFFNGTADIGMRMAVMTRGEADIVACPGLWMRFRPAKGLVMAVIPRRCLGAPRWAQAGAALITTPSMVATMADDDFDPMTDEAEADGTIDIADVGAVDAGQVSAATPALPLGPRVRLG
ncbi:hypothetical protein SAMN04487968_1039 [Nocardioides terrae]|uniref:Uncharacterized protein n=1 Tax=Nocardioides terrae TaxID=574651 RepID=A0A1I1FJD2_9ACTN|nr:hypothetical protein [Nocardioides terrae]SFB99086.1 hypothetical protein SAMN04487968_1039 [Nocardioides terrae]